jgi:hypothetical protein
MNFCATCGRQRTDDARFCAGCGTEFPASASTGTAPAAAVGASLADEPPVSADALPADALPADALPADAVPADATRVERQPDATRVDTQDAVPMKRPAAEPDPFAAWFAADPAEAKAPPPADPPGQWQQPGDAWQSADTVYAAPASRPPGFPPPQPPPYAEQQAPPYGEQQAPPYGGQQAPPYGGQQAPPYAAQQVPPYGGQQAPRPPGGGPPGGKRSSGGRRAGFIIVVLLVMLAAGGGAYALVSRSNHNNTAQPPAPTVTATSTGTASASAQPSASATPSAGASTSAAASASPSAGLVSLAPGVASNPAAPAVEKTLTNYFQGINTHNYAEYSSALDAQEQAGEPASAFRSGYKSTTDSGMQLISLESTGNGGLAAAVTFTSHQAPGTGIDGSSCNNWHLTLYLVQQGNGYLQGAAPSGYKPTYTDC